MTSRLSNWAIALILCTLVNVGCDSESDDNSTPSAGEMTAGEAPAGEEVAGDEMIAGDEVAGEAPAGEEVAGDEMIAGDEVAGEAPAGEEVAGDEMIAGEEVAGEAPAGEEVAGDEMIAGESPAGEDMPGFPEPEMMGEYIDNYMARHVITATTWTQAYEGSAASVFNFQSVDNEANVIIAQNDEMNEYFPSLFSRFDWIEVDGALWFCQTAYDAATAEDALAVEAADSSDPSVSGCGVSSWSSLTAAE